MRQHTVVRDKNTRHIGTSHSSCQVASSKYLEVPLRDALGIVVGNVLAFGPTLVGPTMDSVS
eukprot:COSAG01_NODE_49111_length_375_cov_0.677536_1_plen_61_part_01